MHIDLKMILMIFIINVCYVTLNTIRMMLTMKGYRIAASLVSMVEVTIYVSGLSIVLQHVDNPINLIVYALGYGLGIAIGIKIEDALALGYIMVSVILPEPDNPLPQALRDEGYGVTQSVGYGREGERLMLEILSPRKNERKLYQLIEEVAPKAFVISYEPKYISGGFWTKRISRFSKR